MRRNHIWLWPGVVVISAASVGLLSFGGIESPIRPWLALWFLLVCPGMAVVRLLRLKEALAELTLAIALSIALNTIVASALVYAGAWSAKGGLGILIGISVTGIALQVIHSYRLSRP